MNIDPVWLQTQFSQLTSLAQVKAGGQKTVFSATHPTEGKVALKFFHISLGGDHRALREVDAVRKIQCPRVPMIYELGEANSTIGPVTWVREQWVDGKSLRDQLLTGALTDSDAMRLALHMLEALDTAEQAKIVHRDVKPDNIMVDQSNNFWLLDFGLARHLDMVSLTATGLPYGVGTMGYSPTEQVRNKKDDIDGRADLFALGVTLYECVQGVNPFIKGARDHREMLRRIEAQPLPKLTRNVDAANQFADLVLAMTRPRRDHRLQNCKEALKWIQEICKENGVS